MMARKVSVMLLFAYTLNTVFRMDRLANTSSLYKVHESTLQFPHFRLTGKFDVVSEKARVYFLI